MWDELSESGPPLGYFPNAKKCWLIIKPEREKAAREVFRDTAINVTVEGHKHLGAAPGSRILIVPLRMCWDESRRMGQ